MSVWRGLSEIWREKAVGVCRGLGRGWLAHVSFVMHVVVTVAAMSFLCGCSLIYEDLPECADEMDFMIEADWRDAPYGNPGGMAYMFYPVDGGLPWRFDFPGREAGKVSLPPGRYSVLCFNDDTGFTVLENGDSYSGASLECIPVRDDIKGGAGLYNCPDSIWGASVVDFVLSEEGVEYKSYPDSLMRKSPGRVLTVYPSERTVSVRYILRDMVNLDGVSSMRGRLGSMASGLRLRDFAPEMPLVSFYLPGRRLSEDSAGGSFLAMGDMQEDGCVNMLTVTFTMHDGSEVEKTYDVTSQIHDAPDPRDITILLEGFILPEQQGEGTFDVDVDGWTTIIIDLRN